MQCENQFLLSNTPKCCLISGHFLCLIHIGGCIIPIKFLSLLNNLVFADRECTAVFLYLTCENQIDMTLIYVLETPNLGDAVKTAMDIYSSTGIQPATISNGIDNFKFNCKDAASVCNDNCTAEEYAKKHVVSE